MSYRRAAALARDRAAEARRQADQLPATPARISAIDHEDRPALIAWLLRRIAQEMDAFANELEHAGREEDVTVSGRPPR